MKKREPRPPQHQEPPIQTAVPPPLETTAPGNAVFPNGERNAAPAALVWPPDRPLPSVYASALTPCPGCRRVLLNDHGKAVVITSKTAEIIYFRCRACGRRFKMARAKV